jgi:membrane protein implicated in regulation of membrane protease activity
MHGIESLRALLGVGLAIAAFAITVLVLRLMRPRPAAQPEGPAGFMHLVPGRTYKVIRPFTDFDGLTHPEGETWRFKGYNFLPYDDGLTLIIEPGSLRLQWRPEAQGEIVNDLAAYVAEAS